MRKTVKYFLITAKSTLTKMTLTKTILTATAVILTAVLFTTCDENFEFPERPIPQGEVFIPVESITGIPTKMMPYNEVNLSKSVKLTPSNATNRRIVWSITGASGGTAPSLTNGRWLSVEEEGTVTVTATIKNGAAVGRDFIETFGISVTP